MKAKGTSKRQAYEDRQAKRQRVEREQQVREGRAAREVERRKGYGDLVGHA